MLSGIQVLWHVKCHREENLRRGTASGIPLGCSQRSAFGLVDKILTACTARGLRAVTQTQKYLTPYSAGALQSVKAISSALSDSRGLLYHC